MPGWWDEFHFSSLLAETSSVALNYPASMAAYFLLIGLALCRGDVALSAVL